MGLISQMPMLKNQTIRNVKNLIQNKVLNCLVHLPFPHVRKPLYPKFIILFFSITL